MDAQKCWSCGAELRSPQVPFCSQCGAKLTPAEPVPQAPAYTPQYSLAQDTPAYMPQSSLAREDIRPQAAVPPAEDIRPQAAVPPAVYAPVAYAPAPAAPAAPKKSRTGLVLGILAAVLAVCVAVLVYVTAWAIPNSKYTDALDQMDRGNYQAAIDLFTQLDGFRSSEEMIRLCQYEEAVELKNAGYYEAAIEAFSALGDYSDCKNQIFLCQEGLRQDRYDEAIALKEAGSYPEAIAIFEELGDFSDSRDQAEECTQRMRGELYQKALDLKNSRKYQEAAEIFRTLGDYRDSIANAEACELKVQLQAIQNAPIGGVVTFGSYEQDNDETNGKEPIEWYVLDKSGGEVLLLSKHCLDSAPYNEAHEEVTWESCTLRTWLNNTFYRTAFAGDAAWRVRETYNYADANPDYPAYPGYETFDKVFLLSNREALIYLGWAAPGEATGTAYAQSHGLYLADNGICRWWLRTPGETNADAMGVNLNGEPYTQGNDVHYSDRGVRPAIWVNPYN